MFLFGDKGRGPGSADAAEHLYLKHLQFMRREHAAANLLAFFWSLPSNVARIRRLIQSRRIDIVDVDGITNPVPALAARRERVPILWYYNEPHVPKPVVRLMLPLVTRLSSRVVVQGQKLKEARTRSSEKLRAKTVVLYPGIDTARFHPSRYDGRTRREVREQWGVSSDGPLIGTVGNHRWKGHTYFIEAAKRVKARIPDAKFVIVGLKLDTDRGYAKHLRQRTAQLGLQDDIIYAGFRDDIPKVLSALDVFVLSSIWESCPNVVLEAMAMQVPVVATDVGAVSELVVHGRTGLVVPARDPDALAEAVLAYLTRPARQVRDMAEAARKRVETEFEIARIAWQQQQVYETLVQHAPHL